MRRVLALAPHDVPASFAIRLFRLFSFAALRDRCSLYERVWSKVIHWVRVVLQTLTIHVNVKLTPRPVVMQAVTMPL